MDTRGERLKRARMAAGFESAYAAADTHRWSKDTYASNENGNAPYSFKKATSYGKAFGVRAEWLYSGTGSMTQSRRPGIPILGKVGAGAEGYFEDDYPLGAANDYLPAEDSEGRICLIVEGDSMIPRFRPGEKVVFGRRYEDPTPLLGKEVMARLTDGRKLLKVLRRGSDPGLWTLYSINTAFNPIEDVELEWALPFEELRA